MLKADFVALTGSLVESNGTMTNKLLNVGDLSRRWNYLSSDSSNTPNGFVPKYELFYIITNSSLSGDNKFSRIIKGSIDTSSDGYVTFEYDRINEVNDQVYSCEFQHIEGKIKTVMNLSYDSIIGIEYTKLEII